MDTLAYAASGTFVKVAEIWVPADDRLVHAGGDYGNAPAFAEASLAESFAEGEGLPGRAWQQRRPVVLDGFDGSYFKRTEAASEAGLTSAVAIPLFARDTLKAVLVVLCGDDADLRGAIEVWQATDERLTLTDSDYGNAREFEAASREISFGLGQGLPGTVLAADTPILMRDIARPGTFLRSGDAAAIGWITSGGFAHAAGKSVAMGYIPKEMAGDTGEGAFEIEILGQRRKATITEAPLFDADGSRMRS